MVFKSAPVQLPSNIDPIYKNLDPGNINAAISLIMRQLEIWGVIAARANLPQTRKSAIDVDSLVNKINLGDHNKASRLAYNTVLETTRADQLQAIRELLALLRSNVGDPHIVSTALEGLSRVDHSLVSLDVIEELSLSPSTEHRMAAMFLLWDLAEDSPGQVPLGILGRLARPSDEDWYVQAPAMAITKPLMLHRKHARLISIALPSPPSLRTAARSRMRSPISPA